MMRERVLSVVVRPGRRGWALTAGCILLSVLMPPLLLPLLLLLALAVLIGESRIAAPRAFPRPASVPVLPLSSRAPPRG